MQYKGLPPPVWAQDELTLVAFWESSRPFDEGLYQFVSRHRIILKIFFSTKLKWSCRLVAPSLYACSNLLAVYCAHLTL
jgi:hypothetical protein